MILAGQVAITHWRGAQIVYTVKAVSEKDCCFGMQGLLLPVSLCLYCYLRAHLKQKVNTFYQRAYVDEAWVVYYRMSLVDYLKSRLSDDKN